MKKSLSGLTFLLTVLLLLGSFTSVIASGRNYLFKTSSSLQMTVNQTNPIILNPSGEQTTVPLTITYTYGRFARPSGFPFPNRKTPTTINISISNQPDWCLASLDRGSVEIPIQTFFLKKSTTTTVVANLTVQCSDPFARASHDSAIQFNITAQQNGNIQSSHALFNLTVTPDYFLRYTVFSSASSFLTLDDGKKTNTSVIIQNIGNCKTTYQVQPQILSDSLTVSFDQQPNMIDFTLDIDEQRNLTVSFQSTQPVHQDKSVTTTYTIRAYATDAPLVKGAAQNFTLQVTLKKPVEEKGASFDGSIYFVYLAAVLILLPIIIMFFFSWRKKNISHKKTL